MIDPSYYTNVADEILELYGALDESITRDIVRRLTKGWYLTETAKWQTKMLTESGMLYDEIIEEIAKITNTSEEIVGAIFEDAAVESVDYDNKIYRKAGKKPLPINMSPASMKILDAYIAQTNGLLKNLTNTTAIAAQEIYTKACSLAHTQVVSGAFDYNTAIKNAIDVAISDGNYIQYPSGHKDRIDVAVRRSVLTGVSQTAGQISMAYAEDMGTDLMEINAHAGARPSHAKWQGKIVSLSGKKGYLSLRDIGYGEGNGFKGWNCRHDWYPFFEGISERVYTDKKIDEINDKTVTYNGKEYKLCEAEQKQRSMERTIRNERRELIGYEEAIKNTEDETLKAELQCDFDMVSVKLKSHENMYKNFSKQTGLKTQSERLQVKGFNRSVSQKAVKSSANHHSQWLKDIAAENTSLNTVDKYYESKYNNDKEYNLLIGYNKAIKKEDISPLIGFDLYKNTAAQIEKDLLGIKLTNGIKVENYTTHFIDRVLGQVSDSKKGKRQGVEIATIKSSLLTSTNITQPYERIHKGGIDHRINIISNECFITLSVDEKKLIQVNPL